MAEQPAPRGTDPIAAALAFAIREAVRLQAERECAAEAQPPTIVAMDEAKRGAKSRGRGEAKQDEATQNKANTMKRSEAKRSEAKRRSRSANRTAKRSGEAKRLSIELRPIRILST